MKLDESIEMKNNKKENIKEMNSFKYLPVKHVRAFMNEMFLNNDVSECAYDVLRNEGFLPETLNEDETYFEACNQLMEDDDILMEMYESCMKSVSECGGKVQGWMNEKMENFDENEEVINKFQDQYGKKKGKEIYYATAKKQGRDPETFKMDESADLMNNNFFQRLLKDYYSKLMDLANNMAKIDPILYNKAYNLSENEFNIGDFVNYIRKTEDESFFDYYIRTVEGGNPQYNMIIADFIKPTRKRLISLYGDNIKSYLIENIEETASVLFEVLEKLNDIRGMELRKSEKKSNAGNKDDKFHISDYLSDKRKMTAFGSDSVEYSDLAESIKKIYEEFKVVEPKKGINVDTDNKRNSETENEKQVKMADDTQKTINQKVDNLKNQKYGLNDSEGEINDKLHGFRNNLDLGYSNTLSDDQKARIKDLASGKAPEDHANVDNESMSGEKLIDSAKSRIKDKNVGDDDYTSAHDVTSIEDHDTYKKNSAVNEDIEKMKHLFDYSQNYIKKNKKR